MSGRGARSFAQRLHSLLDAHLFPPIVKVIIDYLPVQALYVVSNARHIYQFAATGSSALVSTTTSSSQKKPREQQQERLEGPWYSSTTLRLLECGSVTDHWIFVVTLRVGTIGPTANTGEQVSRPPSFSFPFRFSFFSCIGISLASALLHLSHICEF